MLIAEDLLLLLTDDRSGRHLLDESALDRGLAGAVLLELATVGAVEIAGPGGQGRRGHVVVRTQAPTSDPVLDAAVRRIVATGPRTPQALLPVLAKGLRPVLLARLTERGILRAREWRVLGIFLARTWPAVDSKHVERLRAALSEVLMMGREASAHETALVSLLYATGSLTKVVSGAPTRELKCRAKTMARDDFAGAAVREAIRAVSSAVMVVAVAGDAGSDGGG